MIIPPVTKSAFILAAGFGTRMRPLTDTIPKPMAKVQDRPLLDHILDKLQAHGINHVTINLHYLGDIIESYYQDYAPINITFSKEDDVLETGGGIKYGLHTIPEDVFFIINGDALWIDANDNKDTGDTALQALTNHWNPDDMDILLLLQPVDTMTVTHGVGDYDIDPHGRAIRSRDKTGRYMFGGIRLTKKSIFDAMPHGKFSYLDLMDQAEKQGRLFAIPNHGEWHHISTPADLTAANSHLKKMKNDG